MSHGSECRVREYLSAEMKFWRIRVVKALGARMKTHPQWLLMIIFSTLILFPQDSDARLFTARLIAVEAETFPLVQLSNSEEENCFPDNHRGLSTEAAARLGKSGEDHGCSSFDSSPEDISKDALEPRPNGQRANATDHDDQYQ
jgi:hypothetical protein